jgi:putative oxidoreductase
LSVINVMAVLSLQEIAPAALGQHILWGSLLAGLAIYGSGSITLDRWMKPYLFAKLGCAVGDGGQTACCGRAM